MPKLQDGNITESSGCAIDQDDPDLFYTINDENGPCYAVDRSDGKTVGKSGINRTLIDPEAICTDVLDNIWIADSGVNGNHDDRPDISLVWRKRFGRHYPGTQNWYKADFEFPGHPIAFNTEAFCIDPTDPTRRIFITKGSTTRAYSTPSSISHGGNYNLSLEINDCGLSWISDACFLPDGNMIACRRSFDEAGDASRGRLYFLTGDTLEYIGFIDVDEVADPEGVGVAWDQKSVTLTSEGKYSTFKNVALPSFLIPGPDYNPCAV